MNRTTSGPGKNSMIKSRFGGANQTNTKTPQDLLNQRGSTDKSEKSAQQQLNQFASANAAPQNHSPVKQDTNTLFKINPSAWKNVPSVVYDCITAIIQRVDIHTRETRNFKDYTNSELRQLGDEIQDAKRSVQDFTESIAKQNEEAKKKTEGQVETEKKHNKNEFIKIKGKIENLRTRIDKDSEQMLR